MTQQRKLFVAVVCFMLCFVLILFASGCGSSSPSSGGEFAGTIYSATSLIDPLTASSSLCYVAPINKYAVKFRDGIHPDSGRGPVLSFGPQEPLVYQLFDGSDWRTDWRWYTQTRQDLVFYFDDTMPEGLTSSGATLWFNANLPLTAYYGHTSCTIYSYERNDIGTKLDVIITW